jgi:hypothetical protein
MFNLINRFRSAFIGMAILAFLTAVPLDQAVAALVETELCTGELNAGTIRTRLVTLLAREEVKVALLQQGINPAEAEARILALTDDEVVQLGEQLGDLPAAGDMGMSGGWIILMVAVMVAITAALIMFGVWAVNKVDTKR